MSFKKGRNAQSAGYILVLTLIMISAAAALVTAIVQSSLNYQRFVKLELEKQKARTLVLGCTELVKSQISLVIAKDSEKDKSPKKDKKDNTEIEKKWLTQLLPIINTWQTIELDNEKFGIDATINLYISCEEGKFNINSIWDANKEKETKKEKSKQEETKNNEPKRSETKVDLLTKENVVAIDNLVKKEIKTSIISILKDSHKRLGRMLEDPTELLPSLTSDTLKYNIFMTKPDQKTKELKNVYLMDLFTVFGNSGKLNPWLMSASVAKVLGLADITQFKKLKEYLKYFKSTMDWAKDWDTIFAPVFGKKLDANLKDVVTAFASKFEASTFSAVCYAKVGGVTQKIYAIFQKTENPEELSSNSIIFRLSKLYWL